MPTAAIDLNDAGLTVLLDPAGPGAPHRLFDDGSPGYAFFDDKQLLTGRDAQSRARLNPRWVHNRFWDALDTEPLPPPFPRNLSRADLAHAHLSELWRRLIAAHPDVDSVILALAGWRSDERIALILGIARACEIPVRGLVDSAVAAAAHALAEPSLLGTRAGDGEQPLRLLHLDAQLHRIVLTELELDRTLVRGRVAVDQDVGLVALHDTWARRLAELFVLHTRFDPMHAAASEQELYRLLPKWLDTTAREGEATLVLEGPSKAHTIDIQADAVESAAAAHYDSVVRLVRSFRAAAEPTTLLLSHRLARLPGLEAKIATESPALEIVRVPANAVAIGALASKQRLLFSGEALPFVVRLDLESAPARTAAALPGAGAGAVVIASEPGEGLANNSASHLVYGGIAYEITGNPFLIGTALPPASVGLQIPSGALDVSPAHCRLYRNTAGLSIEDSSNSGTFVNGVRVEGRALIRLGDSLRLGSTLEIQLITFDKSNGTPKS